MMPKIDQTEGFRAQLTRAVVARAPIIDHRRIERGFVKLVLDEHSPVVGQRRVNLTHAFEIAFERAPKMLLARKISAVSDPNGMRFRAQRLSNFNAFNVVGNRLIPNSFIRMGETAEFVRVPLAWLILKRV